MKYILFIFISSISQAYPKFLKGDTVLITSSKFDDIAIFNSCNKIKRFKVIDLFIYKPKSYKYLLRKHDLSEYCNINLIVDPYEIKKDE